MPQGELKSEWWFQSQMLRQEGEMDCGVCVFGKLVGLTRDEIIFDIPDAVKGITDKQWEAYFNAKGLEMVRHHPGEEHPLPCAHLHQILPGVYHWIYQAEDGGIHDSSESCQHCPPKSLKLSSYNVVLTITIKKQSDKG
jgi:hypothetical protein